MNDIVIVGAGRVGLTLARALRRSGKNVHLLVRAPRALDGDLAATDDWSAPLGTSALVLIAVPDDAIAEVAARLARSGVGAAHTVLHTSGLHDRTVLGALDATGAALGSLHPLQSFPDPSGNPERLHGAPGAVEGGARAVAAARTLAGRLGLTPVFELTDGGKARYHAAAVFASNYVVVLGAIAQRLAGEAGIPEAEARRLFAPIMSETVAQLAERSPGAVLTGPVARGDRGTIDAHLATLDGRVRELYRLLAEEAGQVAAGRQRPGQTGGISSG